MFKLTFGDLSVGHTVVWVIKNILLRGEYSYIFLFYHLKITHSPISAAFLLQ